LSDPPFDLTPQDVAALGDDLVAYHAHFAGLFGRSEQRAWSLKYLQGLLLPIASKSVETMALAVSDGNVRDMQRFVGQGVWDGDALLKRHVELVAESLGDASGVLIVDGSDFPKQGCHSAGVARQYCGALGKIANCQAGVFLAYAAPHGHTLLDRRLYLPQAWLTEAYKDRRQKCGIPKDVPFRTKPQLAWEMIQQVHSDGVLPFSWVACDEAFGDTPEFLEELERAEITYLAEVAVSTRVWLQPPRTEVAAGKGTDRRPVRERVCADSPKPVRADALAQQLPAEAWRTYQIKEGEKAPLQAQFAFARAVAVRQKMPGPPVWVVLRRSLGDPPELKVYLSNAAADADLHELVRVSGQRWPIETCFRQAKGKLGMAEYQTRSWQGWYHHTTLVILAHHFLVLIKLKHKKGPRRLR
jgi:SRSO17 transposase